MQTPRLEIARMLLSVLEDLGYIPWDVIKSVARLTGTDVGEVVRVALEDLPPITGPLEQEKDGSIVRRGRFVFVKRGDEVEVIVWGYPASVSRGELEALEQKMALRGYALHEIWADDSAKLHIVFRRVQVAK